MGLDHAGVADAVQEAHAVALRASGGGNATYIPFLAKFPAQLCAVAAVTRDGRWFEAGNTRFHFAIESIWPWSTAAPSWYDAESRSACVSQLRHADNMTDALAALTAMANCDCPQRKPALDSSMRNGDTNRSQL